VNGTGDVVRIEGVSRSFGPVKAVDGLSLSLGAGEVMGFLGTNGAGKTTTIKMLLGLIRPTSGSVTVFGGNPADPAVRARVGYMPEVATYYPYLNAHELLGFYGGICGLDAKTVRARAEELLEAVGLADAAKRPLKTYSKGMLQRAGIAQALLNDPDLLVLDEPFTGLDPLARIHFRELMRGLRERGKTVFFSSHELGETELLCDRVAIMKAGRCVYHGSVGGIAGDGAGNLERVFLEVLGKGGAS
jgi:ABC-2 type transport system ATP-binding protein